MPTSSRFEVPLISPAFRRAAVYAITGLLIGTAFFHLHRFYSRKFHVVTGAAEWLWAQHKLSSGKELVFFAVREFDLPLRRGAIRIKIAADPEYTLFFNGVEIGGGRARPDVSIDVYEVTNLAKERGNRIVIALRSARGVGGFLASVDAGADLENIIFTNDDWTVHRRWSSSLLQTSSAGERPRSFGRPPFGKWDFPPVRKRELTPAQVRIAQPRSRQQFNAVLPVIRVVSGVAINAGEAATAFAFDFGPTEGRLQLHVPAGRSRVVKVRFANAGSELKEQGEVVPFVIAQDESLVVDPEVRRFRFIAIYDEPGATCSVSST